MNFNNFGINKCIVEAFEKMNFKKPSLIQQKAIPSILQKEDVICQGEAGTGKTLCFLVQVLQYGLEIQQDAYERKARIQQTLVVDNTIQNFENPLPFALIIVPTRELAIQITDILTKLVNKLEGVEKDYFQSHLFIGGLPVEQDRDVLKTRRCTIIIGTVGRIMQMIQEKLMNLCNIKLLVLDEADKLHENYTFQPHFKKILANIVGRNQDQNKPQILCFSATYPTKIIGLIQLCLSNPKLIKSNEEICLENLTQFYIKLNYDDENKSKYQTKTEAIAKIMKQLSIKQTIIFYNDKVRGENLFMDLKAEGFNPVLIHGDLTQSDRIKMMHQLKRNRANLIISTDLLSRGIDVDTLDLVIHFDTPSSYETYLHRIGRTGRFGTFGMSLLLEQTNYKDVQEFIEEEISKLNTKLDEKHCNMVEKKEFYAEFLNGVSDWKQTNYKFYDENKFQYYEDDQKDKDQKNNFEKEEIIIRPRKQKKIQECDDNQNQQQQMDVEVQEQVIPKQNQLIKFNINEIKDILQCKCCREFYSQLKCLSNELEQYFK
ncbi:unnamed protein product [Paramecium octaurelia]|uniref:RNA helicase n=1 Tax=Paramecium octaurelia TaxID=43137 RepID=A0A8S1VI37_PAROT|nr:unnamed protein product [Paramecium octaurelia]